MLYRGATQTKILFGVTALAWGYKAHHINSAYGDHVQGVHEVKKLTELKNGENNGAKIYSHGMNAH